MKEKELSFVDEVLKEFDRYFGNHDNSMFNVWKIGDAITSEITYHKLKQFILENMQEAEKQAVVRYDSIFERNVVGHYITTAVARKEALEEFGIKE